MHLILVLVTGLLAAPICAKSVGINTADANILAEVMAGVSPTLATAIVDDRGAFGVFESIYELVKIKETGVALTAKNRDSITVDTGWDSGC